MSMMLFSFSLIYLLISGIYLTGFQLLFLLMCLSCLMFGEMSFLVEEYWFTMNSLSICSDNLSLMLFWLSYFLVFFVCLMLVCEKDKFGVFFVCLMLVCLFFCFMSSNLLHLYVFFEFSMIPLFFYILFSGSSYERFEACLYLFMYTLLASLVFLTMFTFMKNFTMYFPNMKLLLSFANNGLFWFFLILIFLVKMPVYGLHVWLSKVHVEAPVGGSMLLAGVLLKLGCFGLYRMMYYVNFLKMKSYLYFFMCLFMFGALVACLLCMRQVDIKLLIAYSSVAHMGLLCAVLLSGFSLGWTGGLGMMLAHGFCSSAMFFIGNMIYVRVESRNMMMMKGLYLYFPILGYLWLMFCLCNMGSPPFINFFCEILLLLVIFSKSVIFMFMSLFYLVMVVYYNLLLFLRIFFGKSWGFKFMMKESHMEMYVVLAHLILLNILIFNIEIFLVNFI